MANWLKNLFRRPDPTEVDDGVSPNDKVRQVIGDHGDDGSALRATTFYFYDGDWQGLGRAAQAAGFNARPTAKADGVILEKTIAVDEESFGPVEAQMEAWAEQYGCEFDGWETPVTPGTQQ